MLTYMLYSLKRRKAANQITVWISFLLVVLLNLYFGTMHSYERQLDELAENAPVYCRITNKNGSRDSGLFISERVLDGLSASGMTTDESCAVWLLAGEGEFTQAEWESCVHLQVSGVNRTEAVDGLSADKIHFSQQYDESFFLSDEPVCIVDEGVMRKHGWETGDKIQLTMYYYDASSELFKMELYPLGLIELEIVGSMESLTGVTSAVPPDVILPFEAVRRIYHQQEIPFFADTVSFYVDDPMRLNDFKEEMKSIGLMERDSTAMDSYIGYTLAVRDGDFVTMATQLRQSIEVMRSFLPIVCVLTFLIGYIVSYLLGNGRMGEYALLRLQGMGSVKGTVPFLGEQFILILLGNLLGDALMLLFAEPAVVILVNGVVLTAYGIGIIMAYWRMGRKSVMGLLAVSQ